MAVRIHRLLSLPLLAGGLIALLGAAWRLTHEAVVFDDAFISYRYAQNLCAVASAVPLASAAVIIAPGGGYLPAGADFAPPAPGYAPYAPQPAMGGQGFY